MVCVWLCAVCVCMSGERHTLHTASGCLCTSTSTCYGRKAVLVVECAIIFTRGVPTGMALLHSVVWA